jgi:hypothetical protein
MYVKLNFFQIAYGEGIDEQFFKLNSFCKVSFSILKPTMPYNF